MANLYVVERADFMFLMRRTDLTFGNLSSHLSKLETAGYVRIEKTFKGKKPNTMIHLTPSGRKAFEDYRMGMRRMLEDLSS
ncbi:MAG: transcriptional regulator [Thermoplasmata archaeon]|nr:transcriptional regulator [Thermoplasmata archaeon]NIS11293.1 transcriptional regulator [Thermoplasmata archaeon]NIS19747.1 transcriptional regulator [Thermoplasmata archaeon]NIT76306.1 transcriptional regulator [Thermoplasmata archaeon]NIU48858.1 transcriptional regulator [Thermoplasmata archaeon]